MNNRSILSAVSIATLLLFTLSLRAAEPLLRFGPVPGGKSKVRIEGTSSIHDWQVESALIGGFLEVGPGFPTEAGAAAKPGKIDAKADVFIPVHALKSIEKDGRPYSSSMDDIMYDKLLESTHPRIFYRLESLMLKETPATPEAPYVLDATGNLIVAGVTNKITMPVQVLPLPDKKVKISGSTAVKMTDFGIKPPAPAIALGLIKTGDDVKLVFEWMIAPRAAGAGK